MAQDKQILLQRDEVNRTVTRMAHEVIETAVTPNDLVLIGIRSRGAHLAQRMARKIEEIAKVTPLLAIIDVTPYRDDRTHEQGAASLGGFVTPVSIEDKTVVLIDDVIFSGRTIRAAMDAVSRLGQPKRILVAVLVDRGARELPIRADIVGRNVEASDEQRVNVLLEESDGIDQVILRHWQRRNSL